MMLRFWQLASIEATWAVNACGIHFIHRRDIRGIIGAGY
jgi:hypothetical protein